MIYRPFLVCAFVLVAAAPAVRANFLSSLLGLDEFDGAKDVTFYLYTQNNPTDAEFITLGNASSSPSFNPANPTRVVTHGWFCNVKDWLLPIRDAYIATGNDYNIILVDWSGLAADIIVPTVAKNTVKVGEYVAQVLNDMIQNRDLNPDNLTIIGHSLGGHMAGVIGNRVGGDIVSEVIGLDPASRTFDDYPWEDKLDKSDAKFVQVIHTNDGGAGSADPAGDVDFYPNGGTFQSGCSLLESLLACNHIRALTFFAESITSQGFVASQCSSYVQYKLGRCSSNDHASMGEWSARNASGKYYLATNSDAPYAQGVTSL